MDKNASDAKILKIVDTFDECSMIYFDATRDDLVENTAVSNYDVERPHTNFYECLLKIAKYFLYEEDLGIIEEEIEKQIEDKIHNLQDYLNTEGINQEEVRRALLLLDIKGFKNVNFPLDLITPDATAVICSEFVKYILKDKNDVNLLDFNFGVGNLAFTICTHLDKNIHLIGFDNHSLMANVATMKANMMETHLDMYHEDALDFLPSDVDIVVSDLAGYDYENDHYHSKLFDQGINYFPYLAIEHFLELKKETKFIYLIDKDFFSQKGSNAFREMLKEKGNILSLIALPSNFFIDGSNAKSILILDNKKEKVHNNTEVFVLPPLKEQKSFLQVMSKIEEFLKDN